MSSKTENSSRFPLEKWAPVLRLGLHPCAGSQISRQTVGAIMLPMHFEHFPEMTLPDPEMVQGRGFGFRGPIDLPITLICNQSKSCASRGRMKGFSIRVRFRTRWRRELGLEFEFSKDAPNLRRSVLCRFFRERVGRRMNRPKLSGRQRSREY